MKYRKLLTWNRCMLPRYRTLACMLLLTAIVCRTSAFAQADTSRHHHDSNYYESYSDRITVRTFLSRKYTSPAIRTSKFSGKSVLYMPNTKLNMGIGATYGWFTLNLAYGFDFLNKGEASKGHTRYLDLQSHVYARKWSVDLLGQFYTGFYLSPKGTAESDGGWYTRPDLKVQHMGVAAYRITNWKKFSYRSSMLQNEWQKKSAGSFLLGAEVYFGNVHADSAFIPSTIEANNELKGIYKIRYTTIGPGAGYAYTVVVQDHWYATGSVTGTLSLNVSKQWNEATDATVSIQPGWFYRVGIGYNSSRMNVSMLWVNNDFHTNFDAGYYRLRTGNIRFNIAYRLTGSPKLLKQLRFFSVK